MLNGNAARPTLVPKQMAARPRVLISNDDGVHAPGLQCLVAEIIKRDFCDVLVCGPSGERSAQSHCITIGKEMTVVPIEVPGALEAFAVEGTPADSVMLALNGPVFKDPQVDLVVSGINRGENCGLHVVYSGTVGAAREAACKGIPAIALSSDDHSARSLEAYQVASELTIPIIKGVLGLTPGLPDMLEVSRKHVINVNFPDAHKPDIRGYYLTHMGYSSVCPNFKEVKVAAVDDGDLESAEPNDASSVTERKFRNFAGHFQDDQTEGSDRWAVHNKWVSVTPLGLRQDLHSTLAKSGHARDEDALFTALQALLAAANSEVMKTAPSSL